MVYVKLALSFLAILDTITPTLPPPKQLRPKETRMSLFNGIMKKLQKSGPQRSVFYASYGNNNVFVEFLITPRITNVTVFSL